jgi:hypothetical protein
MDLTSSATGASSTVNFTIRSKPKRNAFTSAGVICAGVALLELGCGWGGGCGGCGKAIGGGVVDVGVCGSWVGSGMGAGKLSWPDSESCSALKK